MTFATKSARFGNGGVQGVPGVATKFDKFAKWKGDTSPHMVGFKVEDSDGNVYRMAHFGADVNRGVLVAQDISESSLGDSDNVLAAASAGQNYVTATIGGSTVINANQYAGGRLIISDDTGEGFTYSVTGNTANSTVGGTVDIYINPPLEAAVATTSDFILVGNKYANLEIATTGTDCYLAGVTCQTMDVSEASYGWVQTKGLVGILMAGSDAIGDKVILSTETNGAVCGIADHSSNTLDQIVGACVVAADATGHGAYYINLE